MDRKAELYRILVARGGRIPDDGGLWRALGQAAGYSGQSDLAGFFGGARPSMVRIAGERMLTAEGWTRATGSGR
jgi:hypothetical protein